MTSQASVRTQLDADALSLTTVQSGLRTRTYQRQLADEPGSIA